MKSSPKLHSRFLTSGPPARFWRKLAGLGVVVLMMLSQTAGRAENHDQLDFRRGFLITGNYVAGGVDLTENAHPIVDGFSTGTIPISGVPAEADIVAAYLFWETITLQSDLSQAAGVQFRGTTLDINDVNTVTRVTENSGATTPCWGSGVPLARHIFRADVLRLLPVRHDKNNKPTIKRLVNDDDLIAHNLSLNTVRLPVRDGNEVPESAGATLFVAFRDPSQPLRKIVVYDGNRTKEALNLAMEQDIQGFYKSAATASAKITHLLASGQPNNNERIAFKTSGNYVDIELNPISGGSASQRGWSTVTTNVSQWMSPGGNFSADYGETVTTKVYHEPANGGNDCLSSAAVIFSTAIADADNDGLPDALEDAVGGLKDPNDTQLPDLATMGASKEQQDLFVEINAMEADPGTTYGTGTAQKTDALGHHHLPTPEDLKRIGDAFLAQGVHVHFDVGDIAAYKARGIVPHTDWIDNYGSAVADAYLISTGAAGGEMITERACDPGPTCQFPDYPGTVGWKVGFQLFRDQPVGDNGEEISLVPPADPENPPPGPPYFNWNAGDKRRRFDRGRKDLFHYVLLGHARARPKSLLPCLKPDPEDLEPPVAMVPTGYDANGTCNTAGWAPNPDFHIPTSVSGVADLPGGDVLITLGLWDEFVARPFVRASTLFHELGHNLELFHGGVEPIWGNKAADTATYIEPNCKPNYLSSMSYMFQVHGLFNDADVINLNYSGPASANLNETATLNDGLSAVGPYRYAWFTPAGSALAAQQGVAAATRFCSGDKFDPASPPASMARVVAASTTSVTPAPGIACTTDWNGDLTCNNALSPDVNFDGTLTASLKGYDDWSRALTRLNQIGAGRRVGKIGLGDFDLLGSGDFDLLGSGDFDLLGSGDFDLLGSGDFDLLGSGDFDLLGSGDFDLLGSGDFDLLGSGQKPIDYENAKGIGRTAPTGLTATLLGANSCLVADAPSQQYTVGSNYHRIRLLWNATTVGAATYQIQRKLASAPDGTYVDVGTSTANTFDDLTELPDGVNFIYRVRATFTDETGTSAWSRPSQPVTAKNCAAVAGNDPIYTAFQNTTLTVAAPGVRGNDYDVDSPATSLSAIALTQPSTGTLTLNASGGFTYKPKNGVTGTVTFTYTVRNVSPSGVPNVPMSADSNIVTVTITIIKK